MKRRIIDKRKKEKYMVDDEYLNGMARLCGWKATLVYNSLCRHASKDQTCFPSIKLMAEQHGVGRDTILRGIKSLEERKVIEVGKTRSKKGYWLNNSYTLTDKSEWDYNHVDESDMVNQVDVSDTPSRRERLDQVDESDTKETHTQGNTSKETHLAEQGSAGFNPLGAEIVKEFSKFNPACKKMYGNKTQRESCDRLVEEYGFEEVMKRIPYLEKTNKIKYMPYISTPKQLEDKWVQLHDNLQKAKQDHDEIKNSIAFS